MISSGKKGSLILSSFFFSVGWFSVAFSMPLLGVRYGFSSTQIGALGFLMAFPFILFSYLMRNSRSDKFLKILRYVPLVITACSLVFIISSPVFYVIGVAIADLMQGLYWIVIEIYLGFVDIKKGAEKYSFSWGVPNFAIPLIMGFVIMDFGFRALFIISAISCIVAFVTTPAVHFPRVQVENRKLQFMQIIPVMFVGVSAGFLYYVVIPYLKVSGLAYNYIGILASIPALVMATGFLFLITMKEVGIRKVAMISSILLSFPLLFVVFHSALDIAIISVVTGIGSSIAFSKILSYITGSSSPSYGVFYFESLFGAGFIVGSLIGGFLFGVFGFYACALLFVLPIMYSIWVYVTGYFHQESSSFPP